MSAYAATLAFDMTDPDGIAAHRHAIAGQAAHDVIREFDDYLRSALEHGDMAYEARVALQHARDTLGRLCIENSIRMYD